MGILRTSLVVVASAVLLTGASPADAAKRRPPERPLRGVA